MKIPVIGTAIVNGTHWIERLLNSVDYPVEKFIIFNNNGRGEIDEELNRLAKIKYEFIDKVIVTHMPSNIGVASAWNLIIKSFVNSPYWIITNHDIAFTPGFLEEMVNEAIDPEVGMVHGKEGDYGIGGYDLFLIKDWVVRDYGLFDENFYPAYCEDADYIMRFVHRPIKTKKGLSKKYLHGETEDYYVSGANTKKSEPGLLEKLEMVNEINFEYMFEKWGPHWRTCWPYLTPFNIENLSIKVTRFDIDYARKKHLGF